MSLLLRPQLKAMDKDLHHRGLALFCLVLMQAYYYSAWLFLCKVSEHFVLGKVPHLGNI